jgi:ferritin
MIPVKDYVIVDFLEWIKENHPEIKSLREIPEKNCSIFAENLHKKDLLPLLTKF